MIQYIFEALKKALQQNTVINTQVNHILLFNQEYVPQQDMLQTDQSTIFITLVNIDWTTLGHNIQQGVIQFDVILHQECLYENQDRFNNSGINHFNLLQEIQNTLQGFSCTYTFLDEFNFLIDTDADVTLLNEVTRQNNKFQTNPNLFNQDRTTQDTALSTTTRYQSLTLDITSILSQYQNGQFATISEFQLPTHE